MYERILPKWSRPSLAVPLRPSLNGCWIDVRGRVGGGLPALSLLARWGHTGRSSDSCTNDRLGRRSRGRWTVTCTGWVPLLCLTAQSNLRGLMNVPLSQVLKKLAKKYCLLTKKRDNTAMYIEDLAGVLQTNLTTTKLWYTHGRHRIETSLFS
jgi:hypothetical protein